MAGRPEPVDLFGNVEGGTVTLNIGGDRQEYRFGVNGRTAKEAARIGAEAGDDTGFEATAALAQAHMRVYDPYHPAAGLTPAEFVEAMVPPCRLDPVPDFDPGGELPDPTGPSA